MGDLAEVALLALVATWDLAVDAVAAVVWAWLPESGLADEIDARLAGAATGPPEPGGERTYSHTRSDATEQTVAPQPRRERPPGAST
jgi:hypothetical protein